VKIAELLDIKENLRSMERADLEKICNILIDNVMAGSEEVKALKKRKKKKKPRDPNSKSERFKRDSKLWLKALDEKYPDAFLHEVGEYVYARTKEFATKNIVDRPISHYVWALYHGKFPAKGRRLMHVDENTRNNIYSNLHPQDGVYE